MTPSFDTDTLAYTATTSNNSNKVTATPIDENAEIEIKVGTTSVTNGGNASWSAGENTLTVKSIGSDETITYTVTVTKEEAVG